jgi:hypothetical protein
MPPTGALSFYVMETPLSTFWCRSLAGRFRWVLWCALGGAVFLLSVTAGAFDRGADGEFAHRQSANFDLYQDVDIDRAGGFYGSRRFEQKILAELERGYERLDDFLGLRPSGRIEVIIYDADVFDSLYSGAFRFAAAGFYHGVIRIRGAVDLDDSLSRVLHHELVHAALDRAAPSLEIPAWVNEGLAEWFEARVQGKRHLNGTEAGILAEAHQRGLLFPMQALSTPSFGHFGPQAAHIAYLQSYGMIEFMAHLKGERALREFCAELLRLQSVERSLKRVYRADLDTLSKKFIADLS